MARFSAPVQTGPGAHSASSTMGTGSFPGVKLSGLGADHPPSSKCRDHERVGLYHYSPSGLSWPVIGRTFTLTPSNGIFVGGGGDDRLSMLFGSTIFLRNSKRRQMASDEVSNLGQQ